MVCVHIHIRCAVLVWCLKLFSTLCAEMSNYLSKTGNYIIIIVINFTVTVSVNALLCMHAIQLAIKNHTDNGLMHL